MAERGEIFLAGCDPRPERWLCAACRAAWPSETGGIVTWPPPGAIGEDWPPGVQS